MNKKIVDFYSYRSLILIIICRLITSSVELVVKSLISAIVYRSCTRYISMKLHSLSSEMSEAV